MTQSTNRLGRLGEDLAARHLEALGYRIVARNWRTSVDDVRGELDIVAQDGATLVFCEVKARRRGQWHDALEGVTGSKQRQLRRLAALFLAQRQSPVAVRFDVVGVTWPVNGGDADVHHIVEAF